MQQYLDIRTADSFLLCLAVAYKLLFLLDIHQFKPSSPFSEVWAFTV